jgi:hypothetical protein
LDEIGDVHALAGARIAFGVLLLLEAHGMAVEQLDEGFFGAHFHVPFIPERFVPSQQMFAMLLAAQAVCAVLVIVGHFARPALFFSAATITYAMLCDRLHFHHNRWALACYAALLALSPCDRARDFRNFFASEKDAPSDGPLWAVRLAQLQVCIVYVSSGSSKLFDPDWRSGAVLLDRMVRYGHVALDRGVPAGLVEFFQQPTVASLLSKGAIATELFLAFALLSRSLRIPAIFVGLCFHAAIELTARVELFSFTTFAAYLLFATPDFRARSLRYDPSRAKSRVLARAVRVLDWLARFDVAPWEADALEQRSFVVTDRDGKPRTGFAAVMTLMRALPLAFPIWAVLSPFVGVRSRS